MSLLPNSNAIETGGYTIQRSLRNRRAASTYMTYTSGATITNQNKWTLSTWLKRGQLGVTQYFLSAYAGSSDSAYLQVFFNASDQIGIAGFSTYWLLTTQVFRDPSAWYHIVIAVDTTLASGTNRVRLYVNGSEVTVFTQDNNPAQNQTLGVNTPSALNRLNADTYGGPSNYFDGYFADYYFIDGQQLTPSSFGETSTTTGAWIPKKYAGTYGSNGWYLPFSNVTSTTTLGYDSSGNSHNFTPTNYSLTAGATYDSMTDVPTLTSATAANFAVMNPLTNGSYTTLSGGNLNTSGNTGADSGNSRSTFAVSSGKWYAEFTLTGVYSSSYPQYGIVTTADANRPNNATPQAGYSANMVNPTASVIYYPSGSKQTNGSSSAYGSSFTTGDVIGIALDSDNGAVYFSKNGTWQNSGVPTSGASKTGAALTWTGGAYEHVMSIAEYNGSGTATNFGQRPFSYTPPTGFVALNTFNLPTPTIKQGNLYMDATIYTGNGGAKTVTNAGGFQPDLVWAKSRSNAYDNILVDSIRGVSNILISNSTAANEYGANAWVTAFNSNGFSVQGQNGTGANGATYVGWQWKGGGTAVTNTTGSTSCQLSANPTAGFSVATFTPPASGTSFTIGHGLGVAPQMIITKIRNNAAVNWFVYHQAMGNTGYMALNATNGNLGPFTGAWNNTSPTSSVATFGSYWIGSSYTMVAYFFAPIAGYSAFGSYSGNGSTDGPFVYCGFRPKYIMTKLHYNGLSAWRIWDTSRSPYNIAQQVLCANLSQQEVTDSSTYIDILANGFKIRNNNSEDNGSGSTYIYAAFAENPFNYSNAR